MNEALYNACRDGDLQEVKRLLAAGADVNAYIHGSRPLHVAVDRERVDVVRFLLDNGAYIDEAVNDGYRETF